MTDMTVAEVREIKEKQSLETAGMTAEELHSYYRRGAAEIQEKIDLFRKEGGMGKRGTQRTANVAASEFPPL
jgi:hypothetical protein